jgi:uncharacterized membrane protein YhaH (DUF805 family)
MSTQTQAQAVPLSQPLYGATIGQAVTRFFTKYATFTGRASRSEYWWWFLVNAIVTIVISIISGISGPSFSVDQAGGFAFGPGYWVNISLSTVWLLATIVPHLALVWRRLHDTDKAGPFYFLGLIPIVGWIIILVLLALPSNPAGARFDR